MQFDIGNHWKYGSIGDWIRQLGHRFAKLDLKGFARKNNGFTKIGEGDLDWADVRKALAEIRGGSRLLRAAASSPSARNPAPGCHCPSIAPPLELMILPCRLI